MGCRLPGVLVVNCSVADPDPTPDPSEPYDFGPHRSIRIRILISSSKNRKNNLDSYCLVISFCLFIFKKIMSMYLQKVIRRFFLYLFFVGILKFNDENSRIRIQIRIRFIRGMDPRIRIHTKMSWIRNTG